MEKCDDKSGGMIVLVSGQVEEGRVFVESVDICVFMVLRCYFGFEFMSEEGWQVLVRLVQEFGGIYGMI